MTDTDSTSRPHTTRTRSQGRADLFAQNRLSDGDSSSFERSFAFLSKVPWEKISIWTIFLFLLWTLRDFFTLILLTFIFAYITNTIVSTLSSRLEVDRRSLTVLIYVAFLGLFLWPGQWFANRVVEQGRPLAQDAAVFIQKLGQEQQQDDASEPPAGTEHVNRGAQAGAPGTSDSSSQEQRTSEEPQTDAEVQADDPSSTVSQEEMREPKEVTWKLRELDYRVRALNEDLKQLKKQRSENDRLTGSSGNSRTSRSLQRTEDVPDHIRTFVNDLLEKNIGSDWLHWVQNRGLYDYFLVEVHQIWKEGLPYITQYANVVLVNIGNFLFTFLLAILFSFLIVFDIPKLKDRLAQFEEGRLSDFYREIAPSLANFGTVMGRTLQAQAMIAVVNTVLTISGIYLMSMVTGIDFIQYLAVLTIIVFVCSFVPVLGVIISTVPIGLIALVKGGIWPLIGIILLILAIHAVETYILNPNIYGVHLRMHPLVVLIVLLVAEHFFGLWGLVLGVPISVYLLDIVIQQTTPEELFYQHPE